MLLLACKLVVEKWTPLRSCPLSHHHYGVEVRFHPHAKRTFLLGRKQDISTLG
jgi:hypothetical protein